MLRVSEQDGGFLPKPSRASNPPWWAAVPNRECETAQRLLDNRRIVAIVEMKRNLGVGLVGESASGRFEHAAQLLGKFVERDDDPTVPEDRRLRSRSALLCVVCAVSAAQTPSASRRRFSPGFSRPGCFSKHNRVPLGVFGRLRAHASLLRPPDLVDRVRGKPFYMEPVETTCAKARAGRSAGEARRKRPTGYGNSCNGNHGSV